MGEIVRFPKRGDRQGRSVSDEVTSDGDVGGSAEILLFTGVRYERHDDHEDHGDVRKQQTACSDQSTSLEA